MKGFSFGLIAGDIAILTLGGMVLAVIRFLKTQKKYERKFNSDTVEETQGIWFGDHGRN